MTTLTKTTEVGLIEITKNNSIQVRVDTVILDDDVEISRTFHRHVLTQGDDLTGQDPKVVAIANAIWN